MKMLLSLLFVGLGLVPWVGKAAADEPGTVVLRGARVIDGTGRTPLENATLVVRDGRIVSLEANGPGAPPAPSPARIVDLAGKTVIPGLISAHSHLGLVKRASPASTENFTRENVAEQLARYEGAGVTAVMSLGVNLDVLYTWRDEQRAGKLPGADIITADRGVGVGGGVPPFPVPPDQVQRPASAEDARQSVRDMASRHPDLIKIWLDDNFGAMPKMSPEVFTAATEEAHRQGLRVAAHLFYLADAKALVTAGVDVLAHSVRDKPVDDELIAAMKARGVIYIPTLSLDESQYIYAEHPAWMDELLFIACVDPALRATWLGPQYREKTLGTPSTLRNRHAFEMAMRNVKTLHDAGITIAMGTDSGAMPTRLAGFGEHRELQLMVQAGLKPMDALVAATAHSATVVGKARERGTLEPGKRADFIVLEANPLDDIRQTTALLEVWHGGKPVVPLTRRGGPTH